MANQSIPSTLTDRARCFAALGDPTRLQVFELVSRGPLAVGEIAAQLPVSRPAVSQHLRVLADAGLVRHQAIGTRHVYAAHSDGVCTMRDFLDSLWDVALARFKAEAQALAGAGTPPTKEERR